MTQREAIRIVCGHENEYVPDPKIGDANNARRKAAWDRKNDELIDDVPAFICGDFEMEMCREPGCDREGVLLCDWPMGRGKTCDIPLCSGHAREIGDDRHLCPIHHPMWIKESGVTRINTWPPPK
jgi:hypothetical protein